MNPGKKITNRTKSARELLSTEKSYVEGLETLKQESIFLTKIVINIRNLKTH